MSVLRAFHFAAVSLFLFEISLACSRPREKYAESQESATVTTSLPNINTSRQWSEWSECYWSGSQCRQSSMRLDCEEAWEDGCETFRDMVIRPCHSFECSSQENRSSESQEMPQIYSPWSRWSPCSSTCRTKRTRTCQLPALCGEDSVLEYDSFCYRGGDHCEKQYLESLGEGLPGLNDTNRVDKEEGHPLDNIECGSPETPEMLIPNRRRAVKDSWPWQVLLLDESGAPVCGGALISDSWVLTAATCTNAAIVRVGEYDLEEREGSEQEQGMGIRRFDPAYVHIHPQFDGRRHSPEFDLALLKLEKPFVLNKHVQPVCLPEPDEEVPDYPEYRGTLVGWGQTSSYQRFRHSERSPTKILQQSLVLFRSCPWLYRSHEGRGSSVLCTVFGRQEEYCSGDSGGPLLRKTNGRWTVYGVTSLEDGCGENKSFGVYANVPFSLDWIKNTTSGVEQHL